MRYTYFWIVGLFLATGCKVGPDYHQPFMEMPTSFVEDRLGMTTEVTDEDLIGWWKQFDDPLLDELLETALCNGFDYRIALERIRQTRAQYYVQFASLFPDFEGDALATRYRISRSFHRSPLNPTFGDFSPIQDFFQIGLDAIWEIDFFGKFRRSADASYNLWEASIEDARTTKITLLSEVAVTYINIRALQKKIVIQKEFIKLTEDLLTLSSDKMASGLGSEQAVQEFIASQESYRATIKLLETDLGQNIYSLGILLGENPEEIIDLFQSEGPIPYALYMIIPAGIPADLLRRRPDVVSAERQLAAATESIGVAVAELFPAVSLAGSSSSFASNPLQGSNIGYSSDEFSQLFKPQSRIWGIGTFIRWPVFDFGKRSASVCVQQSLMRQRYINYQKVIVKALQESESALLAYFNEQDRLGSLDRQAQALHKAFNLNSALYESGLADYQQELQTQERWLQALMNLTESQQNLAIDIVAIYKAIGGDW